MVDISYILKNLGKDGFFIYSGITSREDLVEFTAALGMPYRHRDAADDYVTEITANYAGLGGAGHGGFTSIGLLPHTDRSTELCPPRLLLMTCHQQAPAGGELFVHDFAKALQRIKESSTSVYAFLREAGRCAYVDHDTVYRGPLLNEIDEGCYEIRLRFDENGLYRLGDGGRVDMVLEELAKVQVPVRLSSDQCIVIDNHRCLHSRSSFIGERRVFRTFANTKRLTPGFRVAA